MNTSEKPLLEGLVNFTVDGTSLELSDQVVKKLTPKHLSPSVAKAMTGCLAKFFGGRLLPFDTFDALSANAKGTATHAVLEALLQLPHAERTRERAAAFQEEYAKDGIPGLWTQEMRLFREQISDPQVRTQWDTEIAANLDGYFKIEDPRTVNVVGTEIKLENLEVAGIPFKGLIDRLDVLEDETYRISDYKTGKYNDGKSFGDDHGDQIRDYKLAMQSHPKFSECTVSTGRLLYVTAGKLREPSLITRMVNKTRKEFEQSWETLNGTLESKTAPTKTGPLCAWCPLVNVCPAAKAENKTPDERYSGAWAADKLFDRPATDSSSVVLDNVFERHQGKWGEPDLENELSGFAEKQSVCPTDTGVKENSEPVMGDQIMNNNAQWRRGKPSDGPFIDGHVNTESYEVTAAFGSTTLAWDEINRAGVTVTGILIDSLARLFDQLVARVERSITGSSDPASMFNTRLRGSLRSVLQAQPLPWGQDESAWRAWGNQAQSRIENIAREALSLVSDPNDPNPREAFDPDRAFPALAAAIPNEIWVETA